MDDKEKGGMSTSEERDLLLRIGRIEGKLDAILDRLNVGADRMERFDKRIETNKDRIAELKAVQARHTAVLVIVSIVGSGAMLAAIRALIT